MTELRTTVVTATRGRPGQLGEAIASVAGQCCDHVAEHLILVDDCAETAEMLAGLRSKQFRSVMVPREDREYSGVYRLAELRDIGAELADSPWVTYIDDDNLWETTHLHELLAKAKETGSPAVHSWRSMTYRDGAPYLKEVFPWARDEETGRVMYRDRVERGMYQPGSNVYRDNIDTEVDGGEWLLATDLVRRLRFECVLDEEDWMNRIGEDDKFLEKLHAAGVQMACTESATLIYRMGGPSNAWLGAS